LSQALDIPALDQLFTKARTRNGWSSEPITADAIRRIYDLAKMGPTSANISPARFVWALSAGAKDKLAALALPSNGDKIRKAPVTVIIGYDLDFAERIPELFPHNPGAKDWFVDPAFAETAGFRNGTLQGAYLMLAARALGYDCGPMSGFDNAGVDAAFFAGTRIKSNFICSIGKGTEELLFDRLPRLPFEAASQII
jgi:3-hydroxypropanoate dehydrogenase